MWSYAFFGTEQWMTGNSNRTGQLWPSTNISWEKRPDHMVRWFDRPVSFARHCSISELFSLGCTCKALNKLILEKDQLWLDCWTKSNVQEVPPDLTLGLGKYPTTEMKKTLTHFCIQFQFYGMVGMYSTNWSYVTISFTVTIAFTSAQQLS